MRNAYPNVFSLASMSVNKIKTDENPAVFVEGVEADWRVRMETDPENNQMVRHMMRKAIMEALPESAKNKLENDYRIESMLKTEFRDAVTHYVNLQRKIDADLEKQHVERQRKLVQNQLDNDEGTKKGEIQAPQLGVIAQAPKQDLGQGKMLASGSSPLAIQQPTPIPQVAHGTTPQMPYWERPPQPYPQRQAQKWGHIQVRYRGGGAGRSRGRGGVGRGQNQRDGPQRCWACGELGHIFRHCYKEQNVGEQGDYQPQLGESRGLPLWR